MRTARWLTVVGGGGLHGCVCVSPGACPVFVTCEVHTPRPRGTPPGPRARHPAPVNRMTDVKTLTFPQLRFAGGNKVNELVEPGLEKNEFL